MGCNNGRTKAHFQADDLHSLLICRCRWLLNPNCGKQWHLGWRKDVTRVNVYVCDCGWVCWWRVELSNYGVYGGCFRAAANNKGMELRVNNAWRRFRRRATYRRLLCQHGLRGQYRLRVLHCHCVFLALLAHNGANSDFYQTKRVASGGEYARQSPG